LEADRPLDVYITTRVTFGDVCAGVVNMTTARLSCDDYRVLFPLAVSMITEDWYVDDLLRSGWSLDSLKEIVDQVNIILEKQGCKVKEWIYSEDAVDTKVLGTHWMAELDCIVLRPQFKYKDER
jgi:hypothetical protein